MVEKVALRAVVGIISLDIIGAVAVDGAEADGGAAGQAGEAVGRARAGPAAGDGLRAVLALRPSGVVEAADADAAARGEHPVPALNARPALGGERSDALEAGVRAGLHGRGRGLVVEGRAEAVAQILGGDVKLVCGAGKGEEQNVAHVCLDARRGVVEDVDQACQRDVPSSEAADSEEDGEGEEVRRGISLYCVGV